MNKILDGMAKRDRKKSITYKIWHCIVFGLVFESPTVMTVSYHHEQDKLSIFTGIRSSIIKYLSLRLDVSVIHFLPHTYTTRILPTITGNCSSTNDLQIGQSPVVSNAFHCKNARAISMKQFATEKMQKRHSNRTTITISSSSINLLSQMLESILVIAETVVDVSHRSALCIQFFFGFIP